MKTILLSFLALAFVSFNTPAIQTDKVYICVSSGATVYHEKRSCRGLGSCKHEIKEVTEQQAKDNYGRRRCKVCY